MQPFDEQWVDTPATRTLIPRWQDPRPDLQDDHAVWVQLLTQQFPQEALWLVLHGLRCSGARLRQEGAEWILQQSDEWDMGTRVRVRKKYLLPQAAALSAAFQGLSCATS